MLIGSCFQTIFLLKWLLFSGDIRSFFFFGGGVVSFLFVSPKDWVISGRGSQATMMGKFMGGNQFCDLCKILKLGEHVTMQPEVWSG